jgi:hypothetical protein
VLLRRIVWCLGTVSEGLAASIFRVEVFGPKLHCATNQKATNSLHSICTFSSVLHFEHPGTKRMCSEDVFSLSLKRVFIIDAVGKGKVN